MKIQPIKNNEIFQVENIFKDFIKYDTNKKKYSIDFNNINYDNKKYVLFREKMASFKYIYCEYKEIETVIKNNSNLYEVINPQCEYRKIYMDIDMRKENKLCSYNDINNLCLDFVEYIKEQYKINEPIKYVIQASTETEFYENYKKNKDTQQDIKQFNSFHIIYNVYTNNNLQLKQLITQYKDLKRFSECEYIDLLVYSNLRVMRTLLQSKEPNIKKNEKARTDKLRVLNTNTDFYNNFITVITKTDIYINIEVNEETLNLKLNNFYNIKFNINQEEELYNYIKDLEIFKSICNPEQNTKNWYKSLYLIVNVLYISNIKREDIINNKCITLFIEKTQQQYKGKNKIIKPLEIIKSIVKGKIKYIENDKLFTGLTIKETEFIYNSIEIKNNELLECEFKTINNIKYLGLKYKSIEKNEENENKIIVESINIEENEKPENEIIEYIKNDYEIIENNINLYDTNKKELLLNSKIIKYNNKTVKIAPLEQYNYYLTLISNDNNIKFNDNEFIPIYNWKETKTDILENAFYEAPVGSRKSSLRMDYDIKEILKNDSYKILLPCENINLGTAHFNKWKEYFNENNIELHYIKHYIETENNEMNNENIKIFVCQYDSLFKFTNITFTHIIIDEYTNIRKRINTMNGTNEKKINSLNNFYNLLQKAICIKCYDADLFYYDLEILNNYSNKNFKYYKYIDYKQTNNYIELMNKELLTNEMYKNILENKNISISSNIKKECEKLYDDIIHLKTTVKIALITADGAKTHIYKNYSEDLKKELIKYTDKWEDYNVIIYSPTIITGISQNSNKYFYKHYAYLSSFSTDFTQTAQMLFRVRNTETETIAICDIKNKYDTLIKMNEKEINNIQEIKNFKNNYNNSNNLYEKYVLIDTNENEINKIQYYNNLFSTLKKWGCVNFKYKFHNDLIEKPNKRVDIDYNNVNLNYYTEFQKFINEEYNFISGCDLGDNEKTIKLNTFNISHLMYNYNKCNDLYNYCIYNEFILNYKNSHSIYKKLSLLTHYPLKQVYYKLLDSINLKQFNNSINLQEKHKNDSKNFIIKLYCLCVIFSMFNNEEEYNKFMNDYINNKPINLNYRKKDIENRLKIVDKFNSFMKDNNYIHSIDKFTIIIYAFSYFNIHICDNSICYDTERNIFNNINNKTITIKTNDINNIIGENINLLNETSINISNYRVIELLNDTNNNINQTIEELEKITDIEENFFNELELKGNIIHNKILQTQNAFSENNKNADACVKNLQYRLKFYNDKLKIVNDNIENRELYLNEIQLLKDFNKTDTPETETETIETETIETIETIEETTKKAEKEKKDKIKKIAFNAEFINISINVIHQYKFRLQKELYIINKPERDHNTFLRYDINKINVEQLKNIMNENIYDDLENFITNYEDKEDNFYYTKYNRKISTEYMPKIRLYNTYNDNRINEKILKYVNMYCNEKYNDIQNLIIDIQNNLKVIKIGENEINDISKLFININKDRIKHNKINNNLIDSTIKPENEEEIKETYLNTKYTIYDNEKRINIEQNEIIKISNLGNVYKYVNNECIGKFKPLILESEIKLNRIKENFKYNNNNTKKNKSENLNVKMTYIIVNYDIIFIDRLIKQCYDKYYSNERAIKHIDNDYTNNNNKNLLMVESWNKIHYEAIKKDFKETKKEVNKKDREEKKNDKIKCNVCKNEYVNKNHYQHIATKEHIKKRLQTQTEKCVICDKVFKQCKIEEHNINKIHMKKYKELENNEEIIKKWLEIKKQIKLEMVFCKL